MKARDISMPTLVLVVVSGSLWETWGVLIRSPPVMITNGVALCINLIILAIKFKLDVWNKRTLEMTNVEHTHLIRSLPF